MNSERIQSGVDSRVDQISQRIDHVVNTLDQTRTTLDDTRTALGESRTSIDQRLDHIDGKNQQMFELLERLANQAPRVTGAGTVARADEERML